MNNLPVIVRNDLPFNEVVELKFGRKQIFVSILYGSPAFNHTSNPFASKASNPFTTFFTSDFNAQFQFWSSDGDETPEG